MLKNSGEAAGRRGTCKDVGAVVSHKTGSAGQAPAVTSNEQQASRSTEALKALNVKLGVRG
jgi:hypothetical protein